MDKREAIERIRAHMEVHRIGEYPHIKLAEALNMAIDALRAQQPTTKLDRSRWEGCKFCNKINPTCLKGIMYCAKCGRPITEEAWAELERRI